MGRVIQFPGNPSSKFGLKRAGKRKTKASKSEELGQMNLFQESSKDAKVISMPAGGEYFETALTLDERESEQAMSAYLQAVKMGDKSADAYCNMGVIEYSENKVSQALNNFSKALTEDPRHLEAHFNLANLYSEMGDHKLAKLHYLAAMDIDPHFADSYFNLGLVLISQKNYKEALHVLIQYRVLTGGTDGEANSLIDNLKRTLES